MNKKNMRKNAPRSKEGYLTAKQRMVVKWYQQKRLEQMQENYVLKRI